MMVSSRVFMIVEIRHSKKITMKVKGCVKFDKILLDWVTHLLMTKLRIIKKKNNNRIFNISPLEFENGRNSFACYHQTCSSNPKSINMYLHVHVFDF